MTSDQLENEFLKLLNQYQASIVKLCLLHTDRQPDNVKDLYQEIVYNLWKSFPRYCGNSSPHTWVYRIALNTAYLQYRKRKRLPQFVALNDALCDCIAESSDNELVNRLYQLIDCLNPKEKALLSLYLEGIPQREIATFYHTSEAAINHRINRVKSKLKLLNEHEQ